MDVRGVFMGIAPLGVCISDRYHEEKSQPAEVRYLDRHVRWMYGRLHGGSLCGKIGIIALVCGEVFLGVISVVGVYGLYREMKSYRKCRAMEDFRRRVASTPLPDTMRVDVKTPFLTMNHVDEYCLDQKSGIIWWKRIGSSNKEWKAIYFDGYEEGSFPVAISADGNCLAALDNKQKIHYKYVLKEEWKGEEYHFSDLSGEDNWLPGWCTLPGLGSLIDFLTGMRFRLPKGQSWSIYERGTFNREFQDAAGRTVIDREGGARGLIRVSREDNTLRVLDVWNPKYYFTIVSGPESVRQPFLVASFSISASTSAMLGYESTNGRKGRLCLYTQLADQGTNGDSPFLKYQYTSHKVPAGGIVLPVEPWKRHDLPPVVGRVSFSKEITILQTGKGNSARELRLPGTNVDGESGFYWKNLDEKEWIFIPSPLVHTEEPLPLVTEENIPCHVSNWVGRNMILQNFRNVSDRGTLKLQIGNETVPFLLKRRNNLVIGPLGWPPHYDLVRPRGFENEQIREIFGKKKKVRVNVSVSKNGTTLRIASREWFRKKVCWELTQSQES